MDKVKNFFGVVALVLLNPLTLWLYFGICWIVNLIQFIHCDFEDPYKEEIIHGIGVFSGIGAGVTVWF